jgi:hypothetical protein
MDEQGITPPKRQISPTEAMINDLEMCVARQLHRVCSSNNEAYGVLKHDAQGLLALLQSLETLHRIHALSNGFATVDAKTIAKMALREIEAEKANAKV